MEALFLTLIALALAAGIYGSVLQSGANIVRLDRRMTWVSLAAGAIQLGASVLGYLAGRRILIAGVGGDEHRFWVRALGGVLLAMIGIRMLMKAFQKKTFFEHRIERIDMKKDVLADLQLCVYSALAGVACVCHRRRPALRRQRHHSVCSIKDPPSGRVSGRRVLLS